MKFPSILIFIITCFIGTCFADEHTITYAKPEKNQDYRQGYYVKLLSLLLDKTADEYGVTQLKPSDKTMPQSRAIKQLTHKQGIDIFWTVTSSEREEELIPIRIPLLKGMLGYRVLMIRKEDRTKFSAIDNLEDLKAFNAGQGHDWPDTKILQANLLKVITASTYNGLFSMLHAKRFDFFPRGINEAWQELARQNNSALMIEQHLLLHYPSPIYFFVNKEKQQLAKRIEKGLMLAIEDCSFEQLFYSHPAHKRMFDIAQLDKRTIISLNNPLLPELTPLDSKKLWLNLQ